MTTSRLEAFSDGVLAIIITIMVLELKVPEGDDLSSLKPLIPTFVTYVLSFIYLGIYWNNHHHLMHATTKVSGTVLWANLNLLFWLSLLPFATGYMGENHFESLPTALYGFILFMASISWNLLVYVIKRGDQESALVHKIYTSRLKAISSVVLYALATLISFKWPLAAGIIYVLVAIFWLLPDRRMEREMVN